MKKSNIFTKLSDLNMTAQNMTVFTASIFCIFIILIYSFCISSRSLGNEIYLVQAAIILALAGICFYLTKRPQSKAAPIVLSLVIIFVIIPFLYIQGGGANVGAASWILVTILWMCFLFDGVMKAVFTFLDIAVVFACFQLEMRHPEMIIQTSDKKIEIYVSFTLCIVVAALLYTMVNTVSKSRDNTLRQIKEKNEELKNKSLELEKANDRIEEANRELKEVNAQLVKASQAKSDFLASMSHEIRTPINAVLGMNEMIMRESEDSDIIGYAHDIDSAGRQLLALVNDILDFSKIESGKMEIHENEYELYSLMNDCYNMIYMRAKHKDLKLIVENDPKIPAFLYGDEVRIRQVIMNLLTNAVKYTKDGYIKLTIGFERISNDTIKLIASVKDTGMGIKEEDQKSLFDAFKRVDENVNRNIEGTGLGLAITGSFTELMHGTISVESVYHEGSTFTFTVPQKIVNEGEMGDFSARIQYGGIEEALGNSSEAGNADEGSNVNSKAANQDKEQPKPVGRVGEQEITGASKLAAPKSKKNKSRFIAPEARILVVDDVKMNLNVVRLLLKNTQMEIDMAESGMDALGYTMLKHYDLIFMDHMMPEMDGIETFHNIRSQSMGLNTDTNVVALTANAIVSAQEEYMKEGFTAYLTKPVKGEKLEEILIKYLPPEKVIMNDNAGQ